VSKKSLFGHPPNVVPRWHHINQISLIAIRPKSVLPISAMPACTLTEEERWIQMCSVVKMRLLLTYHINYY